MPILINKDCTCLYIHIPKTGGSSFEIAAVKDGWKKHFSINGIGSSKLACFKSTPQHFHAELLEQVFNMDQFSEILTLVRNPYDRFKSEYYWLSSNGLTAEKPEIWIQKSLEQHTVDPYLYDNHLRQQVEFIPAGREIRIFKLEENGIGKALEVLRELCPKKTIIPGVSSLRRPVQLKRSQYSDEIEAVFERNRAAIESYYQRDYSVLGYSIG